MPISLKTAALRDGLAAVASCRAPKHDTLKLVFLKITPGLLTLAAADGELVARLEIEVEGSQADMACLIAPERMLTVLKESSAPDCSLDIGLDSITLKAGGSRVKLQTVDGDKFPPLPVWEAEKFFTVETTDLVRAVDHTAFAATEDSTRYAIAGVLFDCVGSDLRLAATDSRRIVVEDVLALTSQGDSPTKSAQHWLPTAKHMKQIARLLPTRTTQFIFDSGQAVFRSGGMLVTVQMLAGRFPDWRRVIPGGQPTTVRTVVGPLLSLVRQASVVLNPETNAIELAFCGGSLCVSGVVGDVGSGDFELPVEQTGPSVTVLLAHELLVQFLAAMPRDASLEIGLIDAESAVLFSCGKTRYVLMTITPGVGEQA